MAEELDFYEDDAYEEDPKDVRGITDTVSELSFVDMQFPCICLKNNLVLPKHKWVILSKLIKQSSADKKITVYFIRDNEFLKAGRISGIQIKAIIDILGLDNIYGYHSKEIVLENDKLYVLASQI